MRVGCYHAVCVARLDERHRLIDCIRVRRLVVVVNVIIVVVEVANVHVRCRWRTERAERVEQRSIEAREVRKVGIMAIALGHFELERRRRRASLHRFYACAHVRPQSAQPTTRQNTQANGQRAAAATRRKNAIASAASARARAIRLVAAACKRTSRRASEWRAGE